MSTSLAGLTALALSASAQTPSTTAGFAPANFGNLILTSTPSNATGNGGISNVYTSDGNQFTFGTGGALVNPQEFSYVVTGPNTAMLKYPAANGQPASTTNLVFTSATTGTYTTTSGGDTMTGRFNLAEIPGAAPISNVSSRATIANGGQSIVGFVIAGTMPRRVLIRAVGPALRAFGVTAALQRPMLRLYSGQMLIGTNSAWGTMQSFTSNANIGVTAGGSSSGTSSTSTGSTSGGTSSGTMSTGTPSGSTSGGTTSGTGSTGTAPGSTATTTSGGGTSGGASVANGTVSNGVFTGTLANGSQFTTQLATADDFASVGAFALTPGSNDAAIVAELPPGAYSIVVSANATLRISGATTGGAASGSGSTVTSSTSGGTTTGGTTSGTSSSTTSSSSTMTGTAGGSTSGTGSSGTGSTSTTGTSSTGSTTGGTTSGGTTSGTGSTTSTGLTSGTGISSTATSSTTGDVLVEVYFLQ